jgi:hypothetical protein
MKELGCEIIKNRCTVNLISRSVNHSIKVIPSPIIDNILHNSVLTY